VLYVDWNHGTKENKFKYYETPAGLYRILLYMENPLQYYNNEIIYRHFFHILKHQINPTDTKSYSLEASKGEVIKCAYNETPELYNVLYCLT